MHALRRDMRLKAQPDSVAGAADLAGVEAVPDRHEYVAMRGDVAAGILVLQVPRFSMPGQVLNAAARPRGKAEG
jgi:hypothetical protein